MNQHHGGYGRRYWGGGGGGYRSLSLNRSCVNRRFRSPSATEPNRRIANSFSSNRNNESSGDDTLDSYLSQLRCMGRLTAEEASSIMFAISKYPNYNDTKIIINKSINAYVSMNKRRMDTGGQAIGNPGLYVRSILMKQVENRINDSSTHYPKNGPRQVGSVTQNSNENANLQRLMQNNDIGPNELNEQCALALSRWPTVMAENALKAYVKQKRKREMNGMAKISDPSSYVIAVLRNIVVEKNASSLPMPLPESNDHQNAPAPVFKEQIGNTMKSNTRLPLLTAKPVATAIPSGQMKKSTKKIPPQKRTDQTPTHPQTHAEDESTENIESVNMDYVEKCLSCLVKLEQPVIKQSGVGPKTEASLHKLGIYTLRDSLWHFPRSFIDRSKLQQSVYDVSDGEVGTFKLTVHRDQAKRNSATCTDAAGNEVDVIFFFGRSRQGMMMASNAMENLCKEGVDSMVVSGKIKHSNQKAELFNPDIVVASNQADGVLGIEAVYALSSGLSQKKLTSIIDDALDAVGELLTVLPESLPRKVLEKLRWPKISDAVILAHKPGLMTETREDSPARERIAFEEQSMQQAQLALSRWKLKYAGISLSRKTEIVHPTWRDSPLVSAAVSSLPFDLTLSQMKCLNELWNDSIGGDGRMLRLLQGDVGSGKTVLAYLLGLGCIEARQGGGRVVSLLCPTQLLALQHVQSISDFAAGLQKRLHCNINVELLTGNVVGKARDELLSRLAAVNDNDAIFLVGTHAMVTPGVVKILGNAGLALAVVDEEQRFGVRQRQALTMHAAHSLYLSATPIPRSMSLTRSGMLDVTLLESEPRAVKTTIVSSDDVDKAFSMLKNSIDAGSKCFWVLPRIDHSQVGKEHCDNSGSQQSNVMDRYNSLVQLVGEERVCLLHGRMNERDSEQQLAHFADPSSKAVVLVGTTVIEVGIDIPGVNILIVEDADCFGLSQLHQLRGRIGRARSRSDLQCHCVLLSSGIKNREDSNSLSRLQVLQKSTRGDQIAEADFMLRGPGDMLGYVQSGNPRGFLESATIFGQTFLQGPSKETRRGIMVDGSFPADETLAHLLTEGKVDSFYDRTNASSLQGFALRIMMAFFGKWTNDSSTLDAINTLQILDISKGELSQGDHTVHEKIVEVVHSFCDKNSHSPGAKHSPKETLIKFEETVPAKPHVPVLIDQASMERKVNLLEENVMFFLLDVETTGLDDTSCHIIQLAAKVLGSDDENDLFSEYILPPIDRIPKKIEDFTGITNNFLQNGGYDPALGEERGAAREFRQVFLDFQAFCNERMKKKDYQNAVFIAHNAKFDIRMINGELRRWRLSGAASAPVLGDIFSTSVDTLQLFRERQWWRSKFGRKTALPRPSRFSLLELHSHVFNESIENSHNAVGDIKALERLLLSKSFIGWESIANEIQTPFFKVNA